MPYLRVTDGKVTRLDENQTCVGQGSKHIREMTLMQVSNLGSRGPIYGGVEGKASRLPRSNLGQ